MKSKWSSIFLSIFSLVTALFLTLAAVFELQRGSTGMAVFIFLATVCALIIAWNTRKPYQPRITYVRPEPKNRYYSYRNQTGAR